MSDPGLPPDPIDTAYLRAEAALADEDARAARRARVLAAVAQDTASAEPAPPVRRSMGRRSMARRSMARPAGWLAAAGVAGLGVFLAIRAYPPATRMDRAETLPIEAPSAVPALRKNAAPDMLAKPAARARAVPPAPPVPVPVQVHETPLPPVNIPAPPPIPIAPSPPQPPPPPAPVAVTAATGPADAAGSVVVTAAKRAGLSAAEPPVVSPPAPPVRNRFEAFIASPPDPAAGLRAAAAAGRTSEIETLLAQGVPVDAPDLAGDTALIRSVRAGQPAAAALLRRHGADLDLKNQAGETARTLAAAKNDPALDAALGVER